MNTNSRKNPKFGPSERLFSASSATAPLGEEEHLSRQKSSRLQASGSMKEFTTRNRQPSHKGASYNKMRAKKNRGSA